MKCPNRCTTYWAEWMPVLMYVRLNIIILHVQRAYIVVTYNIIIRDYNVGSLYMYLISDV